MFGTAPPPQRVQIQQMRNGYGFYLWPKLHLSFEEKIVVTDRIVLNVAVGMRWERRNIGIDRLRIEHTLAILGFAARDVAIGQPAPLSSCEVERVDARAEVIV